MQFLNHFYLLYRVWHLTDPQISQFSIDLFQTMDTCCGHNEDLHRLYYGASLFVYKLQPLNLTILSSFSAM